MKKNQKNSCRTAQTEIIGDSDLIKKLLRDIDKIARAEFDQALSMELGYSYAHFDRSELILRGFLALDAIFLGELSVDEIEGDIITTLTTRWTATPRLQLDLQVPYLYRITKYRSRGQDLSSLTTSEADIDITDPGDASIGMSYRLFPENANRPDIVWNSRVTAPTGEEPYGIDIIEVDASNTNLNVPKTLPTGTGLWGVSGKNLRPSNFVCQPELHSLLRRRFCRYWQYTRFADAR
jgi:hypothetical protein